MTAPKLIWAAPWKDCDGEWPEGDWDTHEGRTLDKPCARYIRADAPELVALVEAASAVLHDVDDLIANSEGVAGLHQNGDVADWESLLEGGQFGGWLQSLEAFRAALAKLRGGAW